MDLAFTDDQSELRSTVARVLGDFSPLADARRWAEGAAGGTARWPVMVELGWPALTIAESAGGLGLTAVEAAIVAEEMGRYLTRSPFLATVTQFVPMVQELGDLSQHQTWLAEVAKGNLTAAAAFGGLSPGGDNAVGRVQAIADGRGYRLDGEAEWVLGGADAAVLAVVAEVDDDQGDGWGVFVVDSEQIQAERLEVLDATLDIARVRFSGVQVAADRVLGRPGAVSAAIGRAVEHSTVALAALMVGASQAVVDTDVAYAKGREQFGAPIGSYQAVKHKLVNMYLEVEKARAATYFAALAIAEDDPRRALAVAMAKAAASDCQRTVSKDGCQVLGGIGFTWDHDFHLYMRRLKCCEILLGDGRWHRRNLAAMIGLSLPDQRKAMSP